ncbi:MAG: OmpH family outer membrane protein, partial [Muribaculaceae bacterium]
GVEIQNAGASIEQKRNNGIYLSQESFNKDVEEFNRKQAEAQNILAAQQNKVSRQIAEHQQRINDSIKSFVDSYVAAHKYDAILYREAGVYFNPALDVTADFISGLNERYTPAEKK